jgi:hypothetical protein
MDKYTPEALLDFLTSKEFREGDHRALAVKLGFKPGKQSDLERALEHLGRTGDWLPAVEHYVAHHQDIPQSLGEMIVKSRKKPVGRHPGGRHSRQEERTKQSRNDMVCFFAVTNLMRTPGMKQTPAEKLTGERLHLSRQAVHDGPPVIRLDSISPFASCCPSEAAP